MQYTTLLLSALSITGTLAAPALRRQVAAADTSIRVGLTNQAIELGTGTTFDETALPATRRGGSGLFTQVDLRLGADVQQKTLRCQLLDAAGAPIKLIRNGVEDITFADGGASVPWNFVDGAQAVDSITCDPKLVKGAAGGGAAVKDTSIRVQLNDDSELATQTPFKLAGVSREQQRTVGSFGPYNEVTLTLGADVVKQDLRCQVLDNAGKAIELLRNGNVDTTFAKGEPWSFRNPKSAEVPKIVCDPSFVKAIQA